MKLFTTFLFAISCFLSSGSMLANEKKTDSKLVTYHWTDDKEKLCLNITLEDSLEFLGTYETFRLKDKKTGEAYGLVCEISCRPAKGKTILSDSGDKLGEFILRVYAENTLKPNEVLYTILMKKVYPGWFLIDTSQSYEHGSFTTFTLDANSKPVFASSHLQKGVITFKKLVSLP